MIGTTRTPSTRTVIPTTTTTPQQVVPPRIDTMGSQTRVWVKQQPEKNNKFRNMMSSTAKNKKIEITTTTGSTTRSPAPPPPFPPRKVGTLSGQSSFSTADMTDSSCDNSSYHSLSNNSNNGQRCNLTWNWNEGILQSQTATKLIIKLGTESGGEIVEFPSTAWEDGTVVPANELTATVPDDLITLTHLHEPAVVKSLQDRYSLDQIYTSTGPVLLALNPFQTIPGLYGESVQRKYVEAAEKHHDDDLPPHVYSIADASFRSMMRALEDTLDDNKKNKKKKAKTAAAAAADGAASDSSSSESRNSNGNNNNDNSKVINQSILVSGESGSGKTVTTKFVMKYLAALSQRSVELSQKREERAYLKVEKERLSHSGQPTWATKNKNAPTMTPTAGTGELAVDSIEAQVLQSNPILESFGNARTVRNDNSSRFGKFIEIQFHYGRLVGAQMETYLLEKVRLNRQSAGERNFHIFYQLLSGSVTKSELSQYYLAPTASPEDFKLTNQSGTLTRRDGVSDRETYQELLTALRTMKFTKSEIQDVFSITAAILHASNLQFLERDHDTCTLDSENVHLVPVCRLLGLAVEDLDQALCHCMLTAGGSTVTRSLNVEKANFGLESLLKETYGALFQHLVRRINTQIAGKKHSNAATVGVLDIFGFESFAVNSFEQLCINYCNEALQQQFNAFVLQNEQAEYEREGIQWSFIEFPENQDVLDLIEKRGASILSILDDQCRAPGPSDKAFCLAMYTQLGKQARFDVNRKQQANLQFSIHHYAGPVEYTVTGFTAKNKDELPKETVVLLRKSKKPLVRELSAIMEALHEPPAALDPNATPRKQLHRADSSVGRPTVGGQFRKQLRTLRQKIDLTSPHYIRCLKPNDLLVPDHFDTAIVAEQLKCGGILEAIRVARAGFTQHYKHADFLRRYRTLAWKELASKKVPPSSPSWNQIPRISIRTNRNSTPFRPSHPVRSFLPKSSDDEQKEPEKPELSATEAKTQCKDLLKVLYKKMQQQGVSIQSLANAGEEIKDPSPVAKAKTYTCKTTPRPSWLKQNSPAPSPINTAPASSVSPRNAPTSPSPSGWKRPVTSSDLAKVGIQMGKTKVFLRHKAFEALERIRSTEQTKAATKLNSIFRRYLARIAYLPYRNAVRNAKLRGMGFDESKESKEEFDNSSECRGVNKSFQSIHSSFNRSGASDSLLEKWTELQIREAIHNPIPRHEWGKQAPDATKFMWVIREGLWVKNYELVADSSASTVSSSVSD